MKSKLLAVASILALAAGLYADEIHLKDGTKITGTIVEYENDSFKVQTSYGFATIRKDSIAQIIPSEPAKPADQSKSSSLTPSSLSRAANPTAAPIAANPSQPSVTPSPMPAPRPRSTEPARVAATPVASLSAPKPAAVLAPVVPAASPAAPVPPSPAAPIPPPPIREQVEGTAYTNQTYNFVLYRPPGWDLMPEARKALPNAIAALGTTDETTLIVVGRETLRDSLDSHTANVERVLRQAYENYRPVSNTKLNLGGLPAVQWRFRGVADGHDWSVTALTVARGSDVFTMLGMTYADSDPIIQIRENVIAKVIGSLKFGPAQ